MAPSIAEAGPDLAERIGPVDLTKAPPTLPITCDKCSGALAFEMPCLVGMSILPDRSQPGYHVTECRMAQSGSPLVWQFLLPLAELARNPGMIVRFPEDTPSPPRSSDTIDIGGERAQISTINGSLTFSRVDPSGRAFAGAISGTVVWRTSSGAETTCQIDGPFWGAPGDFI
jgi:hypothetical protein